MSALGIGFVVATTAFSLASCSENEGSPDGSDGAAIAVCRAALRDVAPPDKLATTVGRLVANGYTVKAWTNGQAEGPPNYTCNLVRDNATERGIRLVGLDPKPRMR